MSKSKKTQPQAVNAGVLAAEEALQRARLVRDAAEQELKAARDAMYDAERALREAKVRADDHLPRAEKCTESWRVNQPLRRAVVIVRRTAGTITTRVPGCPDEQQWRKNRAGVWREWPCNWSLSWLELPEGEE